MKYLYGRILRYKRIIEDLKMALEEMTDDEAEAREWVGKAIQCMQQRLDETYEEYQQHRGEEGRFFET